MTADTDMLPFIQAFNRLAISLPSRREEDADPQVQEGRYTTYFAALSDLPLAAVVDSLRRVAAAWLGVLSVHAGVVSRRR